MYECVVKHSELSQKCSRKASQLPSHTAQLIISPTEQFLNWFHFFFHTFLQITAVKINQIFFSLVCFHRVRVVLVSDTDSHRLKKRKSKNRRDDSTNKKKACLPQKPQVPSMPLPGFSIPNLCSLLSITLMEGMEVFCGTAENRW